MERIAYIINPISGTFDKRSVASYIENIADPQDETLIYWTKCAGDATSKARELALNGYNKIVAVGGDGTVNETAQGLINTSAALGIIPLGSGNGLARHLKVPLNYQKAANCIKSGEILKADYGLINGKPFFCTAGSGFDAQVGKRFAKSGRRGFTTYAQTSLLEYLDYQPQRYKITLDGKTFSRQAFLITFANASQWGYNAYIAPDASISDGMLDMVILSPFPIIKAAIVGLRVFTKSIYHSENIEVFRFKNVIVERETSGYIHIDGEPVNDDKILNIECISKSLNVILPEKKNSAFSLKHNF